uniref:Chromosome assembly protein homolog n=1 Tax=Uncultured archaeon GZfos26G2 TaxID=3386331 RepID=Q64AD4_UNCAG|nr:chromosome assembly protein homolog [uncultured archaeon GZfos32E7]
MPKSTDSEPDIWLKEIILENFMSYEYARIPLKPGLNLISGPNGAGKSSILLAISVALGQIYTERSRRLRDLIRRGKELGRITLVFDNEAKNGKRPISFSDADTFLLSRYLKNDGNYWWEADYKQVSYEEVARLFQGFGLDPNNMLIIMHQNTMEQFCLTSPQEKLKLLEDAVGFGSYRAKVVEAKNRLESIISEDESISELLGRAEESLGYWKEMHEKYMQRDELEEQRKWLKREAAWVRVIKQEAASKQLEEQLKVKEYALLSSSEEMEDTREKINLWREKLDSWKINYKEHLYELLHLEKEEAAELNEREKEIGLRAKELKEAIKKLQSVLGAVDRSLESNLDEYISFRVKGEVLKFKRDMLEKEIKAIKSELEKANQKLAGLASLKKKAGERIDTERKQSEIENELNLVAARIDALGEIPEETEEIYSNYSKLFDELKDKSEIVASNKREGLKELESRRKIWRKAITDLLDSINASFKQILAGISATGLARVVNAGSGDLENAGLELFVGFKGSPPVLFDYYTQSGGEKTSLIMAFLLAIQQLLRSPFRAVDEFDIHMDPRNREEIYKMMISSMKGSECLLITPSQLSVTDPSVHVIVVQKAYGKSGVSEVKG